MAKVQYNFGVWYYNGYHLLKDHNLALEWYRRAAAQGLAEAQDAIGVMFMQGESVSQDYQQALAWYRKAARQAACCANASGHHVCIWSRRRAKRQTGYRMVSKSSKTGFCESAISAWRGI